MLLLTKIGAAVVVSHTVQAGVDSRPVGVGGSGAVGDNGGVGDGSVGNNSGSGTEEGGPADGEELGPGLRIRIRCFCMDPDPVFKFLWIRIRFSNFLDLDPEPRFWKIAKRSLKVIYQKKA